METINLPIRRYEELIRAFNKLKELEKVDFDLVRQFVGSLNDLEKGNFKVLA